MSQPQSSGFSSYSKCVVNMEAWDPYKQRMVDAPYKLQKYGPRDPEQRMVYDDRRCDCGRAIYVLEALKDRVMVSGTVKIDCRNNFKETITFTDEEPGIAIEKIKKQISKCSDSVRK